MGIQQSSFDITQGTPPTDPKGAALACASRDSHRFTYGVILKVEPCTNRVLNCEQTLVCRTRLQAGWNSGQRRAGDRRNRELQDTRNSVRDA
jgi:hypothetical protein